MKEIRELTGQGLSYRSREELETALSPRFDIVHSEEELIPLFFEGPVKVLYHLKQTGVNSLSKAWTRRDLLHFCERTCGIRTRRFRTFDLSPPYIIAKRKKV